MQHTDVQHHCQEQDTEPCMRCGTTRIWTPQHVSGKRKLPKRDSEHFLGMLHIVINFLYKPKAESVTCDNINTDSLVESYCQECLTSLLPSVHLMSTVNFITQIQNYKSAPDNIWIHTSRTNHYFIKPVLNGLSDHATALWWVQLKTDARCMGN